MTWTCRRRARSACALAATTAVAALALAPLHAAAAEVMEGTGSGAIVFSSPSGPIDIQPLDLGCSPQELAITGTGAVALTIFGQTYAGPVTFSGSFDDCEFGISLDGSATFDINGSDASGTVSCSLEAVVQWVGTLGFFAGGPCTVNGVTANDNFFIESEPVPSGVTTSPAGVSSFTVPAAWAWSPVVQS